MAATLFGEWSPPGTSEALRAERDVICVIAQPAGAPVVEGGVPQSDLWVEVRRSAPRAVEGQDLPPPLADPRLDFRVDRATALSYEVKAGEFIQIIDVEGRQCSDFLAFHRRKLEDGLERGLDATVTRTLMGNAYPMPGLHAKFYDQDFDPLVETVRDTVGRHDTFALACTSKYYEDMGYFGHTNCTDNFNVQLESYAIAARKGWPALNFFFNTMFTGDNILVIDEPWSRPGDYVLLRAMTDLVCASSACPDDIDPANGWDPTEIHVRVYAPEHTFQAAVAHRVTADAEPEYTKKTGFHPRTEALTRAVHRVPRLLAADRVQQPGRAGRVLGVPREGRRDGPVAAAEVRGAGARRRGAAPGVRDARRAAHRRRPGHVHGDVHRHRRDDRRRDDLPAGRRQLPVRGRRPVRRRVAARAGGGAGPARVGQALDRRAAQRGGAGPGQPRPPARGRVDGAGPDAAGRAALVPVLGGAHRRAAGHPDRRVAHRLHGRAGLRGLVPPEGRRGRVGRDRRSRAAARPDPDGARRARHGADRSRPGLRRIRVRRPGGPVRGRAGLHRGPPHRRGLQRPRRARAAQGAPAARAGRPRAGGQRDRPATATACTSAATRSAWSPAARGRRS